MKRFCLTAVLLIGMPVMAETAVVEALSNFSTANPPKIYKVKFLSNVQLDKDLTLIAGDTVTGKITNVKSPKRLKRNASFSFVPTQYVDSEGNTVTITKNYPASYTTQFDKKRMAKTAVLSVGNHFVKGLSLGYHAIEGAVKDEEDNRLKSGAVALYENSPISYIEEGKEIEFKTGDSFYLKFNTYREADEPNYEFTRLDENK